MEKIIYFVRHGETDFNKQRIIQGGGVDSSLNETGKQQALELFKAYNHLDFQVVFTSLLKRTHQTMHHFLETGIPHFSYGELDEMNWGIHEGQKAAPWMRDNYLEMTGAWKKGDYSARIPEGESAAELGTRTRAFLDIIKERDETRILVCSHGRTLRAISSQLSGLPLSTMERFSHSNTGVTTAKFINGVFNILNVNDTSHLQP